jgi:argininosuccinate lyase
LEDEKYKFLFSVEEVNKLVLAGVPFRDAYVQVGKTIEAGTFRHSKTLNHTHEGSIGNLCNTQIKKAFQATIEKFEFERIAQAIKSLIL